MEKELKALLPEAIAEQKKAILKEIVTKNLHLDFHKKRFDAMPEPKDKEEKERLAHQKLQTTNPLMDDIAIKTEYYNFLCQKES